MAAFFPFFDRLTIQNEMYLLMDQLNQGYGDILKMPSSTRFRFAKMVLMRISREAALAKKASG